jgi:hypothetical protein
MPILAYKLNLLLSNNAPSCKTAELTLARKSTNNLGRFYFLEDYSMNYYPDRLPFRKRFKIFYDFDSQIKSIWLTGYLLITWEYGGFIDVFWQTLDFGWYQGGSYE